MPPYGRRTQTGSSGQNTVWAGIFRGILNVSLRASGTQLGLLFCILTYFFTFSLPHCTFPLLCCNFYLLFAHSFILLTHFFSIFSVLFVLFFVLFHHLFRPFSLFSPILCKIRNMFSKNLKFKIFFGGNCNSQRTFSCYNVKKRNFYR